MDYGRPDLASRGKKGQTQRKALLDEVIAGLSEALDRLSGVDPALTELVDLHFFCGLSFVEIAGLRGVSDRTVQRDWRKARLILHRELASTPP